MSELVTKVFSDLILRLPNGGARDALLEIQKQAEVDLFSNTRGFFSQTDKLKILHLAALKLDEKTQQQASLTFSEVMDAWGGVCSDFHQNYWGFQTSGVVTKPIQSEQEHMVEVEKKKRYRLVLKLIFTIINSWVIMKGVIYYFGTHRSQTEPSTLQEDLFLYGAIALSLSFLMFFLYKNKHEDLE